jgi:hypothetical protein
MILDSVRKRWPWLKHLFADSAYDRTKLMDKACIRKALAGGAPPQVSACTNGLKRARTRPKRRQDFDSIGLRVSGHKCAVECRPAQVPARLSGAVQIISVCSALYRRPAVRSLCCRERR